MGFIPLGLSGFGHGTDPYCIDDLRPSTQIEKQVLAQQGGPLEICRGLVGTANGGVREEWEGREEEW